jgi:hypothetical protein
MGIFHVDKGPPLLIQGGQFLLGIKGLLPIDNRVGSGPAHPLDVRQAGGGLLENRFDPAEGIA